jgi:hypothetical protein
MIDAQKAGELKEAAQQAAMRVITTTNGMPTPMRSGSGRTVDMLSAEGFLGGFSSGMVDSSGFGGMPSLPAGRMFDLGAASAGYGGAAPQSAMTGGGGGAGLQGMFALGKSQSQGRQQQQQQQQQQLPQLPQQQKQQALNGQGKVSGPPQQPQSGNAQQVAKDDKGEPAGGAVSATVDYTAIPTALEAKYGELDVDGALRPTILNTGPTWTKSSKKSLLSPAVSSSLYNEEQRKERERAFDLLDALTKSGFLQLDDAALHVVIAATHCFDKSLVHTVIQDNINPIEKVERSSLIMASTIHGVAPAQLLQSPAQVERVALYSPMLITSAEVAASQRALPAPA